MEQSEEREGLLGGGGHRSAAAGGEGMRQRGAPQDVPQGRAVAEAMFQAFADHEKVTGVPTVMPHEGKDSASWKKAEVYWEERYNRKTKDVIKNKVEAVCWLIAAAFVLNATDFLHTLYRSDAINRPVLNVALSAILLLLLSVFYLVVRIGVVAGVDWDKLYNGLDQAKAQQHPWWPCVRNSVRVGAFTYVVSLVTLPVAIWPVYGWWSLPILFILGMALLMSMHFVPA